MWISSSLRPVFNIFSWDFPTRSQSAWSGRPAARHRGRVGPWRGAVRFSPGRHWNFHVKMRSLDFMAAVLGIALAALKGRISFSSSADLWDAADLVSHFKNLGKKYRELNTCNHFCSFFPQNVSREVCKILCRAVYFFVRIHITAGGAFVTIPDTAWLGCLQPCRYDNEQYQMCLS